MSVTRVTDVELLPPGTPVDLTNCDREPIHVIGGVQPHGALLVVGDGPERKVVQASANVRDVLRTDAHTVLGGTLEGLVGAEAAAILGAAGDAAVADEAGRLYHAVSVAVAGRPFEVAVHRNPAGTVLEFEPAPAAPAMSAAELQATMRRTVAAVARGSSVRAAADLIAHEVRRVTGYDRVWVYRFHEDWHGEVIAESRAASVEESWLGLHYPASDIPAPARALYARNPLRQIVDARAAQVPIEPAVSPVTAEPLDLSDCVLRAVSPMHLEYLANMGVHASMSVSLVRDGRLWGLVSCHHYEGPRQAQYDVRAVCELLAATFAAQLDALEQAEEREHAQRLGAVHVSLLGRMAEAHDVAAGLSSSPDLLLALTEAEGVAICLAEGQCLTMGRTPSHAQVMALAGWLADEGRDTFATDCLGDAHEGASAYADVASGVLAVALSRVKPYYVLWFRPQVQQTIRWGGDPTRKPVRVGADGVARLSPRGSFAAWEEEQQGRSRPWRRSEVDAARALRGTVIDALITRADELAQLNRSLEQSNRELDDFAFVAAHDLKEPLRGIGNYAAMVAEEYEGQPLDEAGLARLETIRRLSRRLHTMVDSLMEHSRVSRLELDLRPVDAQDALDDALDRLSSSILERHARVAVPRPLPTVRADRERLVEVFANLVSNAVKYGGERPEVEVGWRDGEGTPLFWVRDHGIGIDPRHHGVVFRLFKRLHPRDAFGGGSGAGLTIVSKVIERHGGRVWIESEPGVGTTVFFTLAEGHTSARRESA